MRFLIALLLIATVGCEVSQPKPDYTIYYFYVAATVIETSKPEADSVPPVATPEDQAEPGDHPLEFIPDAETAETEEETDLPILKPAEEPAKLQEETQEPIAIKKPWLKAYTRPDCIPCQQFKQDAFNFVDYPRLAALVDRYEVSYVLDRYGQVPRYAVKGSQFLGYNPNNTKQHNDFLDWLSFNSRSVKPCEVR